MSAFFGESDDVVVCVVINKCEEVKSSGEGGSPHWPTWIGVDELAGICCVLG